MKLIQRGSEFSIMLDANELMNSRLSGSEEQLATLACQRILPCKRPSVLIGGLGMGFTVRAALAVLPQDADVVVAELVPAVAEWANGPMAMLHGDSLADPRIQMFIGDVASLICSAKQRYDAIILDVDNGPDGLTTSANNCLYGAAGLGQAKSALTPNGVLAIWSAHSDPLFTKCFRSAGFKVTEHAVRANHKGRGAKHMIWLGTNCAAAIRQPAVE